MGPLHVRPVRLEGGPSRTEALDGFDEALRLDPDHRKSLLNSARVLLETGQPGQALERVERGLGLEPLSAEGLRLLGRARVELGQFDEAIDAYSAPSPSTTATSGP